MTTRRLHWIIGVASAAALSMAGLFLAPELAALYQRATFVKTNPLPAYDVYICGHRVIVENVDPQVIDELKDSQPGTEYGSWRLEAKNDGTYLERALDQLCPECQKSSYLGISDDWVAVYTGAPGCRGQVRTVTKIPVSALPAAERMDLQQGIVFQTEQEGLQLIEGLAALIYD